jgi:hypothetical protein
MSLPELERSLSLHPHRAKILGEVIATKGKRDASSELPPIIQSVTLSSMAGAANITGEVNIQQVAVPDYSAMIDPSLVEMQETWIWNDAEDDYQVVTMAGESTVVYDRPNIFLPRTKQTEGEQPFVQVCPNPLYDYFWGVSECARLYPLQVKRNKRMADIERLLEKQVNPPTAWSGMGLTEEKMRAFDQPGSFIAGQDPSTKRETFIPQIPQDVYADVRQIDQEFDETSGLTNVTQGRGESGVRSAGHAGKLLTVGSARPKKRALLIEDALEKSATLFGKCAYVDDTAELTDDHGKDFIIAQMSPHFTITVDAHSNSPVFMENERENAVMLLKAKAIDREEFIEMIAPGKAQRLIRKLHEKIIPAEQRAAAAQAEAEAKGAAAKSGGKPPLKAVS